MSFEVGNKVGGIHTVLTTKSKEMLRHFGYRYYTIGFYNPNTFYLEIEEQEMPDFIKNIAKNLEKMGIKIRYGKWIFANNVNTIIIDTKEFENKIGSYYTINGEVIKDQNKNWIKRWLWEYYGVDSLFSGYDFTEPVVWSYAVGLFLEEMLNQEHFKNKKIIAHFHEWLSGAGLLYLRWRNLPIATVFTTHATRVGRAKSDRGENLMKEIEKNLSEKRRFDEKEVYKYNIQAQHQLEKACAKYSHVFTTVSEIVSKEAKYFLGKGADIITPNGLDLDELSFGSNWIIKREKLKERVKNFLEAYFSPYYSIKTNDPLIYFISGRYEFYNKGVDLFIEALGKLNRHLKKEDFEKPIFAFLLVMVYDTKPKAEVIENKIAYDEFEKNFRLASDVLLLEFMREELLGPDNFSFDKAIKEVLKDKIAAYRYLQMKRKGKRPPILAFNLPYDERNDSILNALRANGLLNREDDVVKVIYYPTMLTSSDFLLGMDYKEFVSTATLGIFPSRYEPWGYTPFEAAALRVLSMTTNVSGFGKFLQSIGYGNDFPILVMDVLDKSRKEIVDDMVSAMQRVASMNQEEKLKLALEGREIMKILDWKRLIKNHLKAYELAINKL
ncbi:MAG: glycogen/starch synthase [Candidatus Aenigmarchaeota archaeon]|nr:glycogen/starch synthase [Candidatus Aenigmarchaeota archaeon]